MNEQTNFRIWARRPILHNALHHKRERETESNTRIISIINCTERSYGYISWQRYKINNDNNEYLYTSYFVLYSIGA